MQHRFFLLCAALGLTGLVTLAAPIDGKWTVSVQNARGAQTETLTLKSDGSTLTGTLDTGNGTPTNITEGKIDGMSVTFKATRTGRKSTVTTDYAGKLVGDDLKLMPTREGGSGGKGGGAQELDFKRAK
ncbi:MAG TPA: hypothetical protein VGG72_15225 [Bryobacteraceae bacterium]|jgi:hypothetical protein